MTTENQDPQPEKVEVTKEEYASLQASKVVYDNLKAQAEELGMEVMEYHDWLTAEATKGEAPKTPPANQPAKAPVPNTPPQTAEPDRTAYNAATFASLEAMWTGFRYENGQKPEAERLGYSRKELDDVLKSKPNVIRDLMPDCEGNAYLAAATWKDARNIKAKAAETEEQRNKAREISKQTATSLGGGGGLAPTSDPQKARADAIREAVAPSRGFYDGSTA